MRGEGMGKIAFACCLLGGGLLLASSASAQTYSRTEVITYHDNTSKWVIGQIASVTCAASVPASTSCNGDDVMSQTSYHATTALPTATYAFGKLQSSMTYYADGTLNTIKDGRNNTTTLSSWKRGIPQAIQFADGTSQSAVVNDNGWITSVTDENGYATGYTYDTMGRLSGITYPTGDSTIWANSTRSFAPVATAEYGIAAGHWRLTETTGNAVRITYYDGMWRPLVVREYDSANLSGTQRFVRTTYDAQGRVSFQSYPSNTSSPGTGVWTEYDALGRVTSISQDSELGLLSTLTTYGAGFTTTVTDPRGQSTTASYMAYDQPGTDLPVTVNAPEGQVTTISRDPYGKPLQLSRGAIARSYAYNGYQELCRSVEPETGATLYGYDAAGNLSWSAAGLSSGQACSTSGSESAIMARKASRSYDARNRLSTLSFPDGLGNQSWTYTNDGLPNTVTTSNGSESVANAYTYNKRRLLVGEGMTPDALQPSWSIGYGYNGNGHLSTLTYPAGLTVNYAPNALGQPTQAGPYATNVTYYPNGAMKQFTYGNGRVHTLTQNARQLPARSIDSGGAMDLTYAYDGNGNVTAITDSTVAGRQTRSMRYDGLDRLKQASSPMFGTANYAYDAADNLTQVSVSGGSQPRNHYYCYNAGTNRLAFVRTGPSCSTSPATIALTYDVQGNLSAKNGAAYTFDYGNRLRSAQGTETYYYDAQGRRVRTSGTGGLLYEMYSLDGKLLWQRDERIMSRFQYVYLNGSAVAVRKRPIGAATEELFYWHTDALGSQVAASLGTSVVQTSEYEPYGALLNRSPNNRIGYTGHVMDAVTGLTYMQQRYYDPGIGRFLSVDPVTALTNGDMRHFNRYVYAYNNPYKFTDPDGRCGACDRFGDQFARDAAAGNSEVYAPFEKPVLIVTGAMLAGTPVAGPYLATAFKQMMNRVSVRQRPDGVPKNWERRPSKDGKGYEWRNPKNEHDSVRTSTGNPNSSQAGQKEPYVARQSDGKRYDNAGQQVPKKSEESHIPLKDYTHKSAEELRRLNQ